MPSNTAKLTIANNNKTYISVIHAKDNRRIIKNAISRQVCLIAGCGMSQQLVSIAI